jgi:DNA-binding response OmpR family regulator
MQRRTARPENGIHQVGDDTMWPAQQGGPSQPILVVEDDSSQLQMLGILLAYEHYAAMLTEDGQEALEWLAGQRPALVLLDWYLPKVGGYLVAKAIHERYGDQVPIVVLSAGADTTKVAAAGADAFFRKPYPIADLVGTIHRLLSA